MYLLFDIGGTRTRIALSEDGETFGDPIIFSTPKKYDEALTEFGNIVQKNFSDKKISAASVGLPCVFDEKFNKIIAAHNLPLWTGQPIKNDLSKVFSAPVYLENDASLAGLGEAIKGAGKNHKIVAYITVGTGIGGARIVDKKIDRKASGFEPGHQIIDVDKSWFSEKERGSEDYLDFGDMISGSALERRFGVKAHELNDEEVWDEVAKMLSVGLGNTILHWSPDVVVLGGGLVSKISIEKVKTNLKKVLKTFPIHPEIKKAELGDLGGLHGALSYLKQLGY